MGTPIPNRKNELSSPPSKVKKYTLSEEELAKIVGKPIPASHTKPLGFDSKKKEEGESTMKNKPPKFSKDDYLRLRASGMTPEQAAKKLGIELIGLKSYWFKKKWDIQSDAAEEVAVGKFKEKLRAEKEAKRSAEQAEVTVPPPSPAEPPKEEMPPQEEPTPPTIPADYTFKAKILTILVKISKQQSEALKTVLTVKQPHEIVLHHAQTILHTNASWRGELEPLNDMPMDVLISALYYGYDLDLTPEELLTREFEQSDDQSYRTGLQVAAEIFGHKVPGITA